MKKTTQLMKGRWRTALLVLLMCSVGMMKGYAYDFVKDGIYYNITNSSDPKTVEVTFKNDNHQNSYSGDIVIPSIVSYNGNVYSVTRIGHYAFESFNYDGVISVNLPNTIIEIGNYAFDGCTGITSIEIPDSVTTIGIGAFTACRGLTSITIPESVETIEGFAFQHCTNLSIVDFNAIQCTTMGTYNSYNGDYWPVFYYCTTFTTLNIGENVQSIPANAFKDCTSITTVNFNAIYCRSSYFTGLTNITSLSIGDNVQQFAREWFMDTKWFNNQPDGIVYNNGWCIGYKGNQPTGELVIQDGTKHIAGQAFYACNGLTGTLIIPNSVTTIGAGAFGSCTGLTGTLTIPNSVTTIEGGAFRWCTGFTGSLTIGNSVTTIGPCAFYHCTGFTGSLTIPNSVTTIGGGVDYSLGAFCSCIGITSLTIGNSVTTIESHAFYNCSSLTVVNFYADNCTSCLNAFLSDIYSWGDCPITAITIGENVHSIPPNAFQNLESLNTIITMRTTPPTLGTNAFSGISPVATLFVPCGSQLAYFSNWNIFEYNNIHEDCTPRPVSINPNITGGTITPSVSQASMGQEVQLTVTPNSGMALSSLTVYSASDPTQIIPVTPIGKTISTYSFVMPPYGVAVSATFEHGTTYSISISPSISGGSITASTSSATVGETITLDVRPDSGYELRSLSVYNAADASQTVNVTDNTFIMPSFDVMVSASFNYTSVDENGCVSVLIYPNPTSGIIKVETVGLKHITISNMLGQIIYKGNASGNEFTYDFSKYKAGIYLIRIEIASGVAVKKVSVER